MSSTSPPSTAGLGSTSSLSARAAEVKKQKGELRERSVEHFDKTNIEEQEQVREESAPGYCSSDRCKAIGKWVSIALAVVGVVAGLVGLLVYLDVLSLGLTNIGTMSQLTGLYTMVGGFGLAFITCVLFGVKAYLARAKENGGEEQELALAQKTQGKEGPSCWQRYCASKPSEQGEYTA